MSELERMYRWQIRTIDSMRMFWHTPRPINTKSDRDHYVALVPIRLMAGACFLSPDWGREEQALRVSLALLDFAEKGTVEMKSAFLDKNIQTLKFKTGKFADCAWSCQERFPHLFKYPNQEPRNPYGIYRRWSLIEDLREEGLNTREIVEVLTTIDKKSPSLKTSQRKTTHNK